MTTPLTDQELEAIQRRAGLREQGGYKSSTSEDRRMLLAEVRRLQALVGECTCGETGPEGMDISQHLENCGASIYWLRQKESEDLRARVAELERLGNELANAYHGQDCEDFEEQRAWRAAVKP